MARYSSSRGGAPLKLAALILAVVSAISLPVSWHGLRRAGIVMIHNYVSAAGIIVALVLIAYAFRDDLLAPLGRMGPRRASRLIRAWLDSLGWSSKEEAGPPNFVLSATDPGHRNIAVSWRWTPFVGIEISANISVNVDEAEVWQTAQPKEFRSLQIRLVELGLGVSGVNVNNLNDATSAKITFVSLVPRDLINYEQFSRDLREIQGHVALALLLIGDLIDTLKERAAK